MNFHSAELPQMISADELLEYCSALGRYQVLQLILCCFIILSTSSQTLSIIFVAQTPKFWCVEPETFSDDIDTNSTDSCFTNGSCPFLRFSNEIQTAVTKFNLVCDQGHLVSLISTLYMVGFFWGGTIYGYISDRFGRRRACLYSGVHTLICAIVSVFTPNYWLFVAFRVLTALGASGQISVAITYCSEGASSKNRALYLILCQMPWSVSLFFLCFVSFYLHDQTYIDLICATFSLSCVALFFVCYESPRWLISQGRADEARKVIENISRINKKPIEVEPEEFRAWVTYKVAREDEAKNRRVSLKDLLVSPGMRRVTFSLWFIFSIVALVYYGFFFGISSLDGLSIYMQVMIGAAIEFVVNICLFPALKRCERLWLRIVCFFIVGTFTFVVCVLIVDPSNSVIITVLCSIARPLGAFLFNIEVLYCVEIYPTTHRTLGVGCTNAAARLGSILATQLVSIGVFWKPAPYVLITAGCLLVILLTCFLPESKYNSCPETVSKAEDIINNHSFYREQLRCRRRSGITKDETIQEVDFEEE